MRRRQFITLLGGAAVSPIVARAQQAAKLPTIGFLGAATPAAWSEWVAAFTQRLRELGFRCRPTAYLLLICLPLLVINRKGLVTTECLRHFRSRAID
jgi:hypothetical protein